MSLFKTHPVNERLEQATLFALYEPESGWNSNYMIWMECQAQGQFAGAPMGQQLTNWQRDNKKAILQRLGWIRPKADGIIFHYDKNGEEMIVVKRGDFIFLHFVAKAPDTTQNKDCISDVMSLIDIQHPLHLHSQYAQAMLMVLAFVPQPRQLYMLGFGGGRIPMILHHYFPELTISSSESSGGVITLLEMFFGIETSERLSVSHIDGRQHLQHFPHNIFDIILLDGFSNAGDHPDTLATVEFYQLCKSKLATGGVVASNLVDNHPAFEQKMETFCAAFRYVYHFRHEENHVVIGSDQQWLDLNKRLSRAKSIDEKYSLGFQLAPYASRFKRRQYNPHCILLTDAMCG